MNHKLEEIFSGLVSPETLRQISCNFEDIADIHIKQLGVDSLAIMELVLRIEETMDVNIDYETFSVDEVATPRLILNMLASRQPS
ncbi:acyl carrier protein [Paenibacillus sp. FSL K6-1096]|uniref:acyl carrier protein n=1 Tax=Paenibacillus sp. FSL K6-1096 TaxID=2921460 RepID=UPI0030ED98A2